MLRAALLILVGSAGIQCSSAISATLFTAYGSPSVSGARMAIAALIALAVFRPRLRGRSRSEWIGIILYGLTMAVMNLSLYAAISRIPLGVAVTLEFLGPCAVALLAARRVREGLVSVLALAGVACISAGPLGYFDLWGYLAALLAASAFGAYTVLAPRVGKADGGLDGLALSVTVSAIITLPLGLPALLQAAGVLSRGDASGAAPSGSASDLALLALSALIGVVMPYAVDTLAGRISSAQTIGTLFAIDPAMGTLIGFLALDQSLTPLALIGILCVMIAGGLLIWVAGHSAQQKASRGSASGSA